MVPERKKREARVDGSGAPGMSDTPTLTLSKVTVPLHSLAVVSGNWSHLTGDGGSGLEAGCLSGPMMTGAWVLRYPERWQAETLVGGGKGTSLASRSDQGTAGPHASWACAPVEWHRDEAGPMTDRLPVAPPGVPHAQIPAVALRPLLKCPLTGVLPP